MGWISVDDSMPDHGDRVLVYREHDAFGENVTIMLVSEQGFGSMFPPSHWQTLPDPPS